MTNGFPISLNYERACGFGVHWECERGKVSGDARFVCKLNIQKIYEMADLF